MAVVISPRIWTHVYYWPMSMDYPQVICVNVRRMEDVHQPVSFYDEPTDKFIYDHDFVIVQREQRFLQRERTDVLDRLPQHMRFTRADVRQGRENKWHIVLLPRKDYMEIITELRLKYDHDGNINECPYVILHENFTDDERVARANAKKIETRLKDWPMILEMYSVDV